MRMIVPAVVAVLCVAAPLRADVTADRPAAILVFPRIVVSRTESPPDPAFQEKTLTDTYIQVSNTTNEVVNLWCFYVNATGLCSTSGAACDPANGDLSCPEARDLCLPRWTETDFPIVLTPRQPLAWRASRGLRREDLPIDGKFFVGDRGSSNAGTLVPKVKLRQAQGDTDFPVDLFSGELKCIVVDEDGRAIANNAIKGEATIETLFDEVTELSVASTPVASQYNAIGILAIDGDANGDKVLELGGEANEYNACANVLIAQHYFDGAVIEPVYDPVRTELTLVPCTQNLRSAIPGSTTAQFLVFNEFEQRLSTSTRVDCLFRSYLSSIDTRQPNRSIFSVGVAGTLGGHTRIRGVDGGLLGVLTEVAGERQLRTQGIPAGDTAFQLGMQGDREQADRITVPR